MNQLGEREPQGVLVDFNPHKQKSVVPFLPRALMFRLESYLGQTSAYEATVTIPVEQKSHVPSVTPERSRRTAWLRRMVHLERRLPALLRSSEAPSEQVWNRHLRLALSAGLFTETAAYSSLTGLCCAVTWCPPVLKGALPGVGNFPHQRPQLSPRYCSPPTIVPGPC